MRVIYIFCGLEIPVHVCGIGPLRFASKGLIEIQLIHIMRRLFPAFLPEMNPLWPGGVTSHIFTPDFERTTLLFLRAAVLKRRKAKLFVAPAWIVPVKLVGRNAWVTTGASHLDMSEPYLAGELRDCVVQGVEYHLVLVYAMEKVEVLWNA